MSLSEILAVLDAQQRQELSALRGCVDAAELCRARSAKRRLAASSIFFIERSWEDIAPRLETFSLEAESGKLPEELRVYLEGLRCRQPAFAWGWVRARMDAWLMQSLEARVPVLLEEHPAMAARYRNSLRGVDHYWFRETPLRHLKAGYHTALGAACKWYGSTFELLQEMSVSCPHATRSFPSDLHRFASFSLTMLTRTDGYLWDSAAAEPLEATVEGGRVLVARKAVEELSLQSAPDYGVRLGCPALRARSETGLPAFDGIIAWVEQVFARYLMEQSADQ